MAQTQLGYNERMFGTPDQEFKYKSETITGSTDLAAGSIIVPDGTGKFRAATNADKTGASEQFASWRILLEAAAVSGGDVTAKTGITGGCFRDLIVAVTGLTYDDIVTDKLAMNNIFVQTGTSSARIAGEG